MFFFNILLIFFSFLSHCQEKRFLIVDSVDQKEDISLVWYQIRTASNQMSDKQRITNNIHDYKKNKQKLGFINIESITNFIEYGLEDKPPKRYLTTLIQRIQECHPYNNYSKVIYNLTHGDTLIEFILEKLEKIVDNKVILAKDFDENIEFYTDNSIKKVRLKKNDHATIDTQNSLKKEAKESTPPKTNTLFKIKDKDSIKFNIVSYGYFFNDVNNSFTQANIGKNIKNIKKTIENKEPIFFTNFNAIKNYIYFTIGYDNFNHLETRKKLFDICNTLSQTPPYNTKIYQFKPDDREIIDLLDILEKIHNGNLKANELESYCKEITDSAKSSSITQDNAIKIPQEKKDPALSNPQQSVDLRQNSNNSHMPINNDHQKNNSKNPTRDNTNNLSNSTNPQEIEIQSSRKVIANNTTSDTKNENLSSNNKNPSLKKSSIIKYLFGLTLCAASLVCLYTFFNPHILQKIYQSS